jgi:decaprenylphospho-beta-D-erythro-pentofuranosid-2-ulose 2-reductase
MKILVVSATSQIARSCIQAWAESGHHEFLLVGRDQARLDVVGVDLALRYPASQFSVKALDMQSVTAIQEFSNSLGEKALDQVLIAQGSLTDQPKASADLEYLKSELELNAVSVAVWTEALAGVLERQGFGRLGVIGSVASDRGRAYNYSYASSKALLDVYVQGLQQRFSNTDVKVSLIQPGPTDTPMTRTHQGKMANPDEVAKVIISGLAKGRRRIYAPGAWRQIMFIVKLIPWFIFKRLSF